MRLGPVLFIAVCVTLVAILFMVVGAARGLPRAPNPGPAGLSAGDHPKRVGSAGGARRRPWAAPDPSRCGGHVRSTVARGRGSPKAQPAAWHLVRPRPVRQPPRLRWAAVAVDTRSRPPHPQMRHPAAGLLAEPLPTPARPRPRPVRLGPEPRPDRSRRSQVRGLVGGPLGCPLRRMGTRVKPYYQDEAVTIYARRLPR